MTTTNFRDVELISAYLDGQLSQAEVARLEARLKNEPLLRAAMTELNQTRTLLRKLPARRAPRNFTLTPKMAGVKPPLPRAFPIFRFASALAGVLFFFAYMANLSVPAFSAMRAAAPAPAYGMGGGGDANPAAAMEAAPAATLAPEMPAAAPMAAPTGTPELQRMVEATQAATEPAPAEPAPGPGAQAKLNPGAADQTQPVTVSEPLSLPVSPLLLSGLLGLTALSGAAAYFLRLNAEQRWFKARAAQTGKLIDTRQLALLLLALALLAALAASIYWLATTPFYAPVSSFPGFAGGDKGPVTFVNNGPATSGDKGGAVAVIGQGFLLTPGLGYNFSSTDTSGLITAIDFPADVFPGEMPVTYTPGPDTSIPGVPYSMLAAFSLTQSDKSIQPQAPFSISMDYRLDAGSGMDDRNLMLYWWSGEGWTDAASTCATPSTYERMLDVHRVRVSVCQMGSFALVAP